MKPVYLDYASTTPLDPAVARAMSECLGPDGDFGNPASATHVYGQRALERVECARTQVAQLLGAEPDEIVFTSGATESNNLALLGVARAAGRGHIVTTRIEHKAVLDPCRKLEKEGFAVTYLVPDRTGRIELNAVAAACRPDTVLVSVMYANNEIGVLQDIGRIGAICRERNIPFHTDAAQAVGKVPIDLQRLPVDFLSCTAHKLYGPKGIGALFVRRSARPLVRAIAFGGGQERGLRPGTLATHQIVGAGGACAQAIRLMSSEERRVLSLRERLWEGVRAAGGALLNGEGAPRLAGVLNVSFEAVEGESLVTGLRELAISTGSACNSASGEPSYVLRALGRDTQLAQSSLRFSLGRFTTEADIDVAIAAVCREVKRLRAVSPAYASRKEGASTGLGEAPGTCLGQNPCTTPPEGSAAFPGPGSPALSPVAAHYFWQLPHAGSFTDSPSGSAGLQHVVRGEAGGHGQEVWVRLELLVDRDIVKDARFKAYGCPHTLAVTAWLAGQLVGCRREALLPGKPQDWADALAVPVEKLGRLLVVEDALQECLRRWPS